jgi:RyR domain
MAKEFARPKTVLVTGDVTIDHHLYRGIRSTPDSRDALGTALYAERGGAWLLAKLLQRVAHFHAAEEGKGARRAKQPFPYGVQFGLTDVSLRALPTSAHAFAVWGPADSGDVRIWRGVETLGYGCLDTKKRSPRLEGASVSGRIGVAVLDDASLGFRSRLHEQAWPQVIRDGDVSRVDWVVLKMACPLAQGDLWQRVSDGFRKKLIVVIGIDDLRRGAVRVSKGLSWERTALELRHELESNPTVNKLLAARHLIVDLGAEGCLWVDSAANGQRKFRLIFDPGKMEGDFQPSGEHSPAGAMSSFVAGVVHEVALRPADPDLEAGIQRGLAGIRTLALAGHGRVGLEPPAFPYDVVALELARRTTRLSAVEVPAPAGDTQRRRAGVRQRSAGTPSPWMIVEDLAGNVAGASAPLYGAALRLAKLGPRAILNVPYASFGKFFTVDRSEIEALRSIRQLILDYTKDAKNTKPLSLGVFGPPGAGKSFGIKEIARGVLGEKVPLLEFNLSQFSAPAMLIGAFHQIRDRVLEGWVPVVFWDEFDSRSYRWLQYLLAPMQDGKFQEGQITHPIGKSIFVFAGATSYDMEHFGPRKGQVQKEEEFKLRKGPDFISRLNGYLNVLGPNRRMRYDETKGDWHDDSTDVCFPLRRAIQLRVAYGFEKHEMLEIDRGLLSALLGVRRYRYGARSLANIVAHVRLHGSQRSGLPPSPVLSMHVGEEELMSIANRNVPFQATADDLAPAIHEIYWSLAKKEGWRFKWNMPYADLPEEIKADNREAAARIPWVLELIGLCVVRMANRRDRTPARVRETIERNVELLAEAEHDGWMDVKLRNGWILGPRDDEKKIHPALVPYEKLSEPDRKKDRNSVRTYPEIVEKAGFKIVPAEQAGG